MQRLLHEAGYSLQANAKTLEGSQHPDRDAQFRHIHDTAARFLSAGDPVVSVDAKKKENVGQFKNGGREYQPKGSPVRVNVHDFPGDAQESDPVRGLRHRGQHRLGHCRHRSRDRHVRGQHLALLVEHHRQERLSRRQVLADHCGQRRLQRQPRRAWKTELAALATETGLEISVCHLPPGTSKWNKIEHRLFSQITRNWRGRPLTSHETIINLIGATTTTTGLTVTAQLDTAPYPTGVKAERPGDEKPPDHPRSLARRMELHAPSHARHARAGLTRFTTGTKSRQPGLV